MKTKEPVNTLMNGEAEYFLEMMVSAIDGQDTTETKLCTLMKARCQFISGRKRQLSKEIVVESHLMCSLFDPVRNRSLQPLKELIEHIFLEGMREGELKNIDDLGLLSCTFMSFMMDCDYLFVFCTRHDRVRAAIRHMVGLFLRDLRPHQLRMHIPSGHMNA